MPGFKVHLAHAHEIMDNQPENLCMLVVERQVHELTMRAHSMVSQTIHGLLQRFSGWLTKNFMGKLTHACQAPS